MSDWALRISVVSKCCSLDPFDLSLRYSFESSLGKPLRKSITLYSVRSLNNALNHKLSDGGKKKYRINSSSSQALVLTWCCTCLEPRASPQARSDPVHQSATRLGLCCLPQAHVPGSGSALPDWGPVLPPSALQCLPGACIDRSGRCAAPLRFCTTSLESAALDRSPAQLDQDSTQPCTAGSVSHCLQPAYVPSLDPRPPLCTDPACYLAPRALHRGAHGATAPLSPNFGPLSAGRHGSAGHTWSMGWRLSTPGLKDLGV